MFDRLLARLRPHRDRLAPTMASAADAEGLRLSGNEHLAQGRLGLAEADYRAAIAVAPGLATLHVNLGYVLKEQSRLEEALVALHHALQLDDGNFDAHYLRGMVLASLGHSAPAIDALLLAMRLRPDFVGGHAELGQLLLRAGRAADAKRLLGEALSADPGRAGLHLLLGNVHAHSDEAEAAARCFERALELNPTSATAHGNLGLTLQKLGLTAQAAAHFRQALALAPDDPKPGSHLLYMLSHDPQTPPSRFLSEARAHGERLMARAEPYHGWPAAQARSGRPLRVGLLSGDLRQHPVGYFLAAVLEAWDPARIEPWAYSANPYDDAVSARLKRRFAVWRDVGPMDDPMLARTIRDDGVQVLLDLAGHTDLSRIEVLAWRPAPVQASWLGWFATTGLPAMDWFIADPVSVPPAHHAHFSERIALLPDTRFCYTPLEGAPEPGPPPCMARGFPTFGCFQGLHKINDDVLRAWAAILQALPASRLRLQCVGAEDTGRRNALLRRAAAIGLDIGRVALQGRSDRAGYLAAHTQVDLLLDTFPFSGATTTCEALWLGVPTVTLAGDRLLGRQGASLMACAGLNDWIAESPEDYASLAVRWAQDPAALAALRCELPARVAASPLYDAPRYAWHMMALLETMWRERASTLPTPAAPLSA